MKNRVRSYIIQASDKQLAYNALYAVKDVQCVQILFNKGICNQQGAERISLEDKKYYVAFDIINQRYCRITVKRLKADDDHETIRIIDVDNLSENERSIKEIVE